MTRKQKIALLNGLRNGTLPISDIYLDWPYRTFYIYINSEGYVEENGKPVSAEDADTVVKTYPKTEVIAVEWDALAVKEHILKKHQAGHTLFVDVPEPLTAAEKKQLKMNKIANSLAKIRVEKAILQCEANSPEYDDEDREELEGLIESLDEEAEGLEDELHEDDADDEDASRDPKPNKYFEECIAETPEMHQKRLLEKIRNQTRKETEIEKETERERVEKSQPPPSNIAPEPEQPPSTRNIEDSPYAHFLRGNLLSTDEMIERMTRRFR